MIKISLTDEQAEMVYELVAIEFATARYELSIKRKKGDCDHKGYVALEKNLKKMKLLYDSLRDSLNERKSP
jgi:hypothetical protein